MVEREKWILYKHTNNYDIIKNVAFYIKNDCVSKINGEAREKLQETSVNNPRTSGKLDSANHRINTLEFFMFGYEERNEKRFIFSPLGNLFLDNINDEEKLKKIFTAMLFGIQFQNYASGTPPSFQLYPFRLLFALMCDERLDFKLYNTEYAYIIAFVKEINSENYERLVREILEFRALNDEEKMKLLKEDEHASVNCIYEWQYYVKKLLLNMGILGGEAGNEIGKLFHPKKPSSISSPTSRKVYNGYAAIDSNLINFVKSMLNEYSCFQKPLRLDDSHRMYLDVVKEIYSFYPRILLREIDLVEDELQTRLLELPRLINTYSENPDNSTAYLFENVLEEGFNMFINVEATKKGGAGHTDIECLYTTKKTKFAVEAKSTGSKLSAINSGRLKIHRDEIGGKYTIVITPKYVPAAKRDIEGNAVVIILASTFSEYLYNHIYHDVREIDFGDFDDIISNNLGKDISKEISDLTMKKFAVKNR